MLNLEEDKCGWTYCCDCAAWDCMHVKLYKERLSGKPFPDVDVARLNKEMDWIREQAGKVKDREWRQCRWATGDVDWNNRLSPLRYQVSMRAELMGLDKGTTTLAPMCGTAFCAAGNTCYNAGDMLLIPSVQFHARKDFQQALYVLTVEGEIKTIGERGQELLGLTDAEAGLFFEANNDLTTMEEIYDLIMERVPELT